MPLPSYIIAAVISATIDMTAQLPDNISPYQDYARAQLLPPQARHGLMKPPSGDGYVLIGDKALRLSPAIQIRNRQNMIVVPMNVNEENYVIYLTDMYDSVHRVWMITNEEAALLQDPEPPVASP